MDTCCFPKPKSYINDVIRTCVKHVAVKRCPIIAMNCSGMGKIIAGHNPTSAINNQNILKAADKI